jgi:hypothetical protein
MGKEVHFTYKLDRNQSNWLVSFRLCYKKVKNSFCVVILSRFFVLCMMKDSLKMWTEYSSSIICVYIQYCGAHFCRRQFSVNSSVAGWKLCFFYQVSYLTIIVGVFLQLLSFIEVKFLWWYFRLYFEVVFKNCAVNSARALQWLC